MPTLLKQTITSSYQSTNHPTTIFIAWLNLDLGIQTCFYRYNRMDAYAKTWSDLVFPVYIWVIVGFLVYISSRSVIVTKLLGSSPVPVLATFFLLSYAKLLRTMIAALTLTVLHYPDKNVVVYGFMMQMCIHPTSSPRPVATD